MATARSKLPQVRKKSLRYHHGDLRNALVHAAFKLVQERGPYEWTLREAAQLAGVSPGAPYRHFADKSALISHAVADGYRALLERLGGKRDRAGMLREATQFAADNRALACMMLSIDRARDEHVKKTVDALAALGATYDDRAFLREILGSMALVAVFGE